MPNRPISISEEARQRLDNIPARMKVPEELLSTEESSPQMSGSGALLIQHSDNQGNTVKRTITRREGKGRSETFEVPTQ